MKTRMTLVSIVAIAATATLADASIVQLSVQVTPNAGNTGGTYKIFETVTDPSLTGGGKTLGIYDTDVVVSSTAGITLATGSNKMPKVSNGLTLDDGATQVDTGFILLGHSTSGTDGAGHKTFDIGASQDLTLQFNSTNGHTDIITGFGLPGQTSGPAGDGPVTFGDPALVAQGTYTGSGGNIVVSDLPGGNPTNTLLLPAALPSTSDPNTNGQSPIGPIPADLVLGGFAVVPTPEPATLALFGLAGIGALRRRRRI